MQGGSGRDEGCHCCFRPETEVPAARMREPSRHAVCTPARTQRGIGPSAPNVRPMHPELRRARALYHEWRLLPQRELARLAPFAREVKELALDLRGRIDSVAAEHELAQANEALDAMLRHSALRAA